MRGNMFIAVVCVLVATCFVAPASIAAQEFVRGDLNSDGVASLADVYYFIQWGLRDGPPPECLNTSDIHDFGELFAVGPGASWPESPIGQLLYGVHTGHGIPDPFRAPGLDPTPNTDPALDCTSYGNGSTIDDAGAKLSILDAVTEGGDDAEVTLRIALSSSRSIVGYSGTVYFPDGGVSLETDVDTPRYKGLVRGSFDDLTGTATVTTMEDFFVWNNRLRFVFLTSVYGDGPLPEIEAGEERVVAELTVCLEKGVTAGELPMVLEEAELVDADTASRIVPRLEAGTITIQNDLADGVGCASLVPAGCGVEPEDVHARFSLGDAVTRPGGNVTLPMTVRTNSSFVGFSTSIDFDEELLQGTSYEPVFERPDGAELFFVVHGFDNRNDVPGNSGTDEGYFWYAAVFATDATGVLHAPAHEDVVIGRLHFHVNPDVEVPTTTEVSFLDGAVGEDPHDVPFSNSIHLCGEHVDPETASSFTLVAAVLEIVDEVTVFVRGDANGDDVVDVSDAVATLGYLFLGNASLWCYDAADANDDGRLDITDPVTVLLSLFQTGEPLPSPYPESGVDPTEDPMSCLVEAS